MTPDESRHDTHDHDHDHDHDHAGPAGAHDADAEPLHSRVFHLARLLARHERRPGRGGGRGLHRGQGRVLALLELRQSMSQRELAFLLGVRPQSLGELLGKLERAGLVQRATDPNDRRTMTVELTATGKEAAAEARTAQTHADSDPLDALSAEERAELARLLDLVIARIEEEDGRLPGPGHRPGHGPERGGPFDDLGPLGPGGPRAGGPFGPRGRGRFGRPGREADAGTSDFVADPFGMHSPGVEGSTWSDRGTDPTAGPARNGGPERRRGRGRRGDWQAGWREPRAAW